MKFHPVKLVLSFLFGLSALSLAFPDESYALKVKRGSLKLNGKFRVIGLRCDLQVTPTSATANKIRCSGTKNTAARRSTPGIVYLTRNDEFRLTGSRCFLNATRLSATQYSFRCTSRRPTPTPTATIIPTATATSIPLPTNTPTVTPTPNANIAIGADQLISFNTSALSGAGAATAITGLTAGDVIVGIDRRPQNGFLYGLGFNSGAGTVQLYAIASDTFVARPVGTSGTFVDSGAVPVMIAGSAFDIDFNPAADRIRIINNSGQNFRMNPNTGAFVDGDLGGASGSVSGLNMDGSINGGTTTAQGAAYTNNQANTSITTLYTLDQTTDRLCIQTPPNVGTQASCLNLNPTVTSVFGFEIIAGVNTSSSNTAVAAGSGYMIATNGSAVENLTQVDLTSGAVTTLGQIGNNVTGIVSLAVQSSTGGVRMLSLTADGANLIRFNSLTPGTTTTVPTSGVNAGETLVGIDFRPATGQLMALGVDESADTATLYLLDPQSGAATVVGGSPGQIAFTTDGSTPVDLPDPATTGYGFNFNPQVDRVRVTSGSGLNFRVNPVDGTAVDGNLGMGGAVSGTNPDGTINGGGASGIDGAAYTNSSSGVAVTTLYTLDSASNSLFVQNAPNAGSQTLNQVLTLSGSTLDFTALYGFDIPFNVRASSANAAVTSGVGYATFTVAGTTGLYSINLPNASVTSLGTIGSGNIPIRGLAVAQESVN